MPELKREKAKSPYQRYHKTPYRYSPEYLAWRAAALRHIKGAPEAEMVRLGWIHSAKFDPRRSDVARAA